MGKRQNSGDVEKPVKRSKVSPQERQSDTARLQDLWYRYRALCRRGLTLNADNWHYFWSKLSRKDKEKCLCQLLENVSVNDVNDYIDPTTSKPLPSVRFLDILRRAPLLDWQTVVHKSLIHECVDGHVLCQLIYDCGHSCLLNIYGHPSYTKVQLLVLPVRNSSRLLHLTGKGRVRLSDCLHEPTMLALTFLRIKLPIALQPLLRSYMEPHVVVIY